MAKGQMRSNREKKKPKKSAAEKAKAGSSSAYVPPSGNAMKPIARKP
jgi:hypothetical protein